MNSDFKKNCGSPDWKEKSFYVNCYALFTLSYLSTTVAVFLIVLLIDKYVLTLS